MKLVEVCACICVLLYVFACSFSILKLYDSYAESIKQYEIVNNALMLIDKKILQKESNSIEELSQWLINLQEESIIGNALIKRTSSHTAMCTISVGNEQISVLASVQNGDGYESSTK